MLHKTIKVTDVSHFYWCDTKAEATKKSKELEKQGITVYIGGKRGKTHFNYLDIQTAAIYQNKGNGSDSNWVAAW